MSKRGKFTGWVKFGAKWPVLTSSSVSRSETRGEVKGKRNQFRPLTRFRVLLCKGGNWDPTSIANGRLMDWTQKHTFSSGHGSLKIPRRARLNRDPK